MSKTTKKKQPAEAPMPVSKAPLAMQGRANPKHVFWIWGVFGNLILFMVLGIATSYGLPANGVLLAVTGYFFYLVILLRRNSRAYGWSWFRIICLAIIAHPITWLSLFSNVGTLTGWW